MKKRAITTFIVIMMSVYFSAVGAYAMSLGDVGRVCLFSSISGTITLDGKPVVNARLVRTGDRDGPRVDETFTNEEGYFEFPAMYERTITKFLPMEFVASQKIIAHYQDREYEMWSSIKRKREENSEAKGNRLVVACDLGWDQKLIVVNGSPIHSLCVWDVEPDPKIDWETEGFFDK